MTQSGDNANEENRKRNLYSSNNEQDKSDVEKYIGRQLRAFRADDIKPAIPDRFLGLMKELEKKAENNGAVDRELNHGGTDDHVPVHTKTESSRPISKDDILAQLRDWWGGKSEM